jgi:hypothetical protein
MKNIPRPVVHPLPAAPHKSRRVKKDPLNPRSFLWQIILSYLAHGSMPSWGLPFETIAASILLRDRDGENKSADSNYEKDAEKDSSL